jgi:hypothetical protein
VTHTRSYSLEHIMSDVSIITISLSPPYPESGMISAIVRMTGRDKICLDEAASQLGLTRAVLMRVLLVKGAECILSELGITIAYEQNTHIDLSKGETLIE